MRCDPGSETTFPSPRSPKHIPPRFTKPVAVFADVGMFLSTGTRGARANLASSGNGTEDVTFV